MKFSNIAVLVMMLSPLIGCEEKTSGENSKEQALSKHLNESTPLNQVNWDELSSTHPIAKLQKDAESGNAEAQSNLGDMYRSGEGVPKDTVKAVEWYQKAAAQGDAQAQKSLGFMYDNGVGVLEDDVKAIEWYQKAAAQGHSEALFYLGWMYRNGEGVPKDVVKAFEWWQKAAAQGYSEAQVKLGEMYADGEGMPKNSVKAHEWFQKAAKRGYDNIYGLSDLGYRYYQGNGVPKDAVIAVEWFQKAAAQGYPDAQYSLGIMYSHGEGVPKDAVKAVEWYQKAAEQGHAEAQNYLGTMYSDGEGVPKDAVKAVEWFQKAAAQGNAGAQDNLGWMYAHGEGVPKDAVKAVEWYQKAAAQGNDRGQSHLGYMYVIGEGISKDEIIAYAWFNLAAAQGNASAQSNRDLCEKKLSTAERMEGQRLASNWKKIDKYSSLDSVDLNDTPTQELIKQATGTAFAVSNEGHALTNHHVINGCTEVKVAGREGVAKVITSDSVNDLALFQLPGKSDDFAKLNPEPGKLRQGEDVIVFGYPLNWALSSGGNLTPGTVSALTGLGNNTNQIQITAPIQPGSSGSPVMDKKGNVIAVVSMMLDDSKMTKLTGQVGQNVNFAVNGQTVKSFLDANKVPYKTGGGLFTMEKSNADIADEARKWTVLVECWK